MNGINFLPPSVRLSHLLSPSLSLYPASLSSLSFSFLLSRSTPPSLSPSPSLFISFSLCHSHSPALSHFGLLPLHHSSLSLSLFSLSSFFHSHLLPPPLPVSPLRPAGCGLEGRRVEWVVQSGGQPPFAGADVSLAQFSFFFRPNKSILIPHIPFSASVPPPGGTASDGSSPASSRIPLERSRGK